MRELGGAARSPVRIYFTGGASAVLLGWRKSTVDIDYRVEPDNADVLAGIPTLKERLEINLEPASPQDFIPELSGWRDRARFIAQEGPASFFHYDFYAQALAKIERGHAQDLADVRSMLGFGLVEIVRLEAAFQEIERSLSEDHRYSAIDARAFRRSFTETLAKAAERSEPA